PSESCGLQYDEHQKGGLLGEGFSDESGLPVINIAGCPVHPNWVSETLVQLASGELQQQHLDHVGRPRSYADHLVHHGCPRNEFYEYKASAEKSSDLGCMMEHMGCLGTQAHADCNTRLWNGEGSCLRGGYACINCTAPGFEEPGHPFTETPKIAGIPVGLPTDMPKAWFVALASLAKAATPKRLKENAVADHIRVPPSRKPGEKT
ncbi:MAG: HupU protein, partial [Candidatus Thiodiazotropha endolucinida]|nr:HupU protein [Candidatus Thiodiazotropha taylori]MCW4313508.1 HupU protein [Candidatus Thiodiazotropha taylori]